MQRLETEAKTIGKLLAVENKNLWPPVMDALTVAKGYEKALGAALGDDLDAPVDPSAPMRWAGAALDPADPALPEGAEPLSRFVKAPPELARRLAQIGVVERGDGAAPRGVAQAGPAAGVARRRLLALGRLCRRRARADRRGAAARRTRPAADRSRGELATARSEVEAKRRVVEAAEAALPPAAAPETEARARWREAQHQTDAAREEHAAAEREISRNAARISALKEAKQRDRRRPRREP